LTATSGGKRTVGAVATTVSKLRWFDGDLVDLMNAQALDQLG
jgi:hypothetical protein